MLSEAATRLRDAARTRTPCQPVRDLIPPDDVAAAYAVQQELTAARLAEGRRVVGRKIGLTSPAVQAQLGVGSPDFGVLFDDMERTGEAAAAELLQPRIEAEIAFVLATDVLDPDDVRPAVAYAVAALEIVDSRIADWDISLADTVADNASSGRYVLGPRAVPLTGFEPREAVMAMTVDGEVASTGSGAACLGDPLAALAWLARASAAYGQPLRAGEVVLSGALGPMVPVRAGLRVRAEISGLGDVEVRFS